MKLLYEALNTVEAHMILNLLEQAGLSARIDGEYLQGGVGELQAIGVVRVMVEDADYADANEIIMEWDAKQPEQERQDQVTKRKSSVSTGVIGFICGLVVMAVYYNTPVTDDGIDYDGDGLLDEKWTYVNYRLSKTEVDRNFDQKTDLIYKFDRMGLIESSMSDDNFDGVFETDIYYDYGNAIWQKSDTTGDGFKDYRVTFKSGLVDTIRFVNPETKKVIKVQHYGPAKMIKSEIDTTGDGVLDTLHEYDAIEEIDRQSTR